MSSINKVILVGRVGKDPAVRSMNNGDKVASFSLATGESWKDKNTGERKESTDWHNIVVYNDHIVKVVESYVKKGSLIGIEGQVKTRKYQDQGGADRYVTEVVLQKFRGELTLLGSKGDGGNGGEPNGESSGGKPKAQSRPAATDLDDDIPF